MKRITVNGSVRELDAGTLKDAVAACGFEPERVIAELNGAVVDAASEVPVADGDELNLFRIVAGG